jgi:hypothetical protein
VQPPAHHELLRPTGWAHQSLGTRHATTNSDPDGRPDSGRRFFDASGRGDERGELQYGLADAASQRDGGLRDVLVRLDDQRAVRTDERGRFEFTGLSVGQYRLGMPLDHFGPGVRVTTPVDPVPPAHALRSIEGHVYVRSAGDGERGDQADGRKVLRPLAGLKVMAHGNVVVTDEAGRFVLRDLPAGELFVSVVPTGSVPSDVKVPVGRLRMPMEPTQIDNATIVIDNPRLLEYLLDRVNDVSK